MTRWHLVREGRIVATAWSSNGDVAERELQPLTTDLLVSDEDWWAAHWRRRLLHPSSQVLTLRQHELIERRLRRVNKARIRDKLAHIESRLARQEAQIMCGREALLAIAQQAIQAKGRGASFLCGKIDNNEVVDIRRRAKRDAAQLKGG